MCRLRFVGSFLLTFITSLSWQFELIEEQIPCGTDGNPQSITIAGYNIGPNCFLRMDSLNDERIFHNLVCIEATAEILEKAFKDYASLHCSKNLKLYLPDLSFVPEPELFSPVSQYLQTLIIKNWDPCGESGCDLDGSPFRHLTELKLLDISFAEEAVVDKIHRNFLHGMFQLETLVFEKLPDDVILEKGILKGKNEYETLECLSLISSSISCSCDHHDPMYWLHHYLQSNPDIWSRKDRIHLYRDQRTSQGNLFPCLIDLKCKNPVDGEIDGLKVTRFHERHWKQKCTHEHPVKRAHHEKEEPKEPVQLMVMEEEPSVMELRSCSSGSGTPFLITLLLLVFVSAFRF